MLLAASVAIGQQPTAWKTGAAFRRQLDTSEGINWQDRSLRDGLARLADAYGVALFLDRRIDPGQLVTLTVREQPLEAILRRIAAEAEADIAILAPVVYIGPPDAAARLTAVAALRRQEVAKLPNEAKSRLLKSQAWQSEELAEPRQLLVELARQASISVDNSDAVPHDLWPAVNLPPLPWIDRLTLLLAGFGLTFEIDERGMSVKLVEQRAPPSIARQDRPPGSVSKLGLGARGGKVAKKQVEKLYSLQVTNEPAGKVLRKVAESLGKELKYDNRVLDKLRQPVQLNLKDATLEYLLDMTLKPLGLSWQVTDEALEVTEPK